MHQPCPDMPTVTPDRAVCEHGSLRRKCDICDLSEQVATLEREIRRLRIRLGLATGRVTEWWRFEQVTEYQKIWMKAKPWYAVRFLQHSMPIRLGDGRAEQEQPHD